MERPLNLRHRRNLRMRHTPSTDFADYADLEKPGTGADGTFPILFPFIAVITLVACVPWPGLPEGIEKVVDRRLIPQKESQPENS